MDGIIKIDVTALSCKQKEECGGEIEYAQEITADLADPVAVVTTAWAPLAAAGRRDV